VLLFDLNGLKRINDTRGHLVGNWALCRLAVFFTSPVDRLTRRRGYGGEKFTILLPETGAHEADAVGRRIANGCPTIARSLCFSERWNCGLPRGWHNH